METISKRLIGILCLMFVICGCNKKDIFLAKDYLAVLANETGIKESNEINECFDELNKWNVVDEEDYKLLEKELEYDFVKKTVNRLLNDEYLSDDNHPVGKEEATRIIEEAVNRLNNPEIIYKADYVLNENIVTVNDYKLEGNRLITKTELRENDVIEIDEGFYKVKGFIDDDYLIKEAETDDIYESLDIADSFEIDFEEVEVIPYEESDVSGYINNSYNLLSAGSKEYISDGFKVSYSFNSSGINVHISKNIDKKNIYADISLSSVKPTFRYTSTNKDLKNVFFKVSFKTSEKMGVSIGKYSNYYLDFKDDNAEEFLKKLKRKINIEEDGVAATIPICKIKTPLKNIPYVYLNIDLLAKIHTSGKIEIVFANNHEVGFEIKDGNIRFINKYKNNYDAIVKATAKALLGINFSVDASSKRLMDIELDAGVKAEAKSTLHLYDAEGNSEAIESNYNYGLLEDISKENEFVRVCGDVSLCYDAELHLNTSKTLLNSLGFTKSFYILDDDNQIFNNLTHIENGHFVEKCTRNKRVSFDIKKNEFNAEKIMLDKYSVIINQNDTYTVKVSSLPDGYVKEDLVLKSEDDSIASANGMNIYGNNVGNTVITVSTSDNKYHAYLNVLIRSK